MEANLEKSFPIMRDTLQLQNIIKIKSNQLGEHMLFFKGKGGFSSNINNRELSKNTMRNGKR